MNTNDDAADDDYDNDEYIYNVTLSYRILYAILFYLWKIHLHETGKIRAITTEKQIEDRCGVDESYRICNGKKNKLAWNQFYLKECYNGVNSC
jgi:hypothetical protein